MAEAITSSVAVTCESNSRKAGDEINESHIDIKNTDHIDSGANRLHSLKVNKKKSFNIC